MGHVPVRQCMLCHEKYEKTQLLRIVKNEDVIELDALQKKNGRGAYLCSKCKNSEMILKKRILDRAFKQKVATEVYDLLKEQ